MNASMKSPLSQARQCLRPLRIHQLRWQRRLHDWRSGVRFAQGQDSSPLPVRLTHHKSLLLRRLGDTDRQLQRNKVVNLALAIPGLNGLQIQPGETLSLWRRIGRATASKGYLAGVQLSQGRVTVGIGGGLCQLANLIHWMALHTPLELIERHHHSFDPFPDEGRVLPFGSGASLFYNYIDLRFRNPTDQPMQLLVWLDTNHLCGEIRTLEPPPLAYHVVEKDHRYEQEGELRFRCNTIWQRQIDRRSGQLVHERCLYANRSRVMY
jgi:vancomycin resistance protein VanW